MLKQDNAGYYIVESVLDLKQWHRLTDLTMREKIQLKAELDPPKVKKKNPKQSVPKGADESLPFVKTRKKVTKKIERPEQTAFDKWFN